MGDFPYITKIHVINSRVQRDFDIEVPLDEDGSFRHLILTGRNGCGKTSILEAISEEIIPPAYFDIPTRSETALLFKKNPRQLGPRHTRHLEEIESFPICTLRHAGNLDTAPKGLYTYIKADRQSDMAPVQGPSNLEITFQESTVSKSFRQFLVNQRTEQAYAREDGDTDIADKLAAWFDDLESWYQDFLEDDGAQLKFDRNNYDFRFLLSDNRSIGFHELSRGQSAITALLAEILIRHEYLKRENPGQPVRGIVLIDEVETHLHLELQRLILPFLTKIFPHIQFIAATHSPVVIASLPNAIVYDLSSNESTDEPLGAYPYGILAKEYFGLSSDYAEFVETKRQRALDLADKKDLSDTELKELQILANELDELNPSLALKAKLALARANQSDRE